MNTEKQSKAVDNQITQATVYLTGAQITRSCHVRFDAEREDFVFGGLPAGLQPDSIQVSAQGSAVILSVAHDVNYMATAEPTEELAALGEQLESLNDELARENGKLTLCEQEENFFGNNMCLAGNDTGLRADDLKEAVLFYGERMALIQETRLVCNKKIEELNRQIQAVHNQLGDIRNARPKPVSEITVAATAEIGTEAELTLSYYISDAGWTPCYDIRVRDPAGDITLLCKANVRQNSDEAWEDVKLTLSTGNPAISGECPELFPWYIGREPQAMAVRASMNMDMLESKSVEYASADMDMDLRRGSPPPMAVRSESASSVEYTITARHSIASGEDRDVEIATHSLAASYRYYCVRKLGREVFLLAAVRGYEQLDLIAGEASVFFENRYVGRTYIDPTRADEQLDLSLGADPAVIVTRTRGKDFTAKTLTGGGVRQTRQWELTARNLKSAPIELELLDQIPVSVNKQITVDPAELSGAELDRETGILKWKFTLEPAGSKTTTVKYVVTHPKEMRVILE